MQLFTFLNHLVNIIPTVKPPRAEGGAAPMKNFYLKSASYLVVLRMASIVKDRAKSGDKVIKILEIT